MNGPESARILRLSRAMRKCFPDWAAEAGSKSGTAIAIESASWAARGSGEFEEIIASSVNPLWRLAHQGAREAEEHRRSTQF